MTTTDTAPDVTSEQAVTTTCSCGCASPAARPDAVGATPAVVATSSCTCGSGDSTGCGPDCGCGTG